MGGKQKPYQMWQPGISLAASPLARSRIPPATQARTGLVVSAGCTEASTRLQGKIYRPEGSLQVALYSEKSQCTFESQYLASQHLYRPEVTDM